MYLCGRKQAFSTQQKLVWPWLDHPQLQVDHHWQMFTSPEMLKYVALISYFINLFRAFTLKMCLHVLHKFSSCIYIMLVFTIWIFNTKLIDLFFKFVFCLHFLFTFYIFLHMLSINEAVWLSILSYLVEAGVQCRWWYVCCC